ncbi:MAG: Murein hydrolase activator EnvC [Gemmatimonadaceae bacterium]|nr:Murein hydrolase activator EnvC [Gemmatimonadaceae bacterium]
MRRVPVLAVATIVACATPWPTLMAQSSVDQRLRAQREELDRIRRERDELQRKRSVLAGRVHDLSDEVVNSRRQAEATARLVRSLNAQLVAIAAEVDSASARVAAAQDEVRNRNRVLHRRVTDIYKRGPLHTTEALLSARSFAELVARYKYLHELALRDRSMVNRVQQLYASIASQRELLVRLQDELARNRSEKQREEQRLRNLVGARQASLLQAQQTAADVEERLKRIARDEQRLADVIASLEASRRKAEAAPNAAAPTTSSIRTSDFGKLGWPVEGDILYRFGRLVNPNNTTIRWNGIGIRADAGAQVKAIAAGEVMVADQIGTYGQTVIVQHGGGDYSVYGSLGRIDVRKGQQVIKGQVIGTVGRADPDMDPHLHFEIRPKGRAMDPLAWLQERSGRR